MAEEIGGSECTRKNTSLLSYRPFSEYTGPPCIAKAIFAIFAQRNIQNCLWGEGGVMDQSMDWGSVFLGHPPTLLRPRAVYKPQLKSRYNKH